MPELRKDPISGRWVIIAHERAKRPHDFKGEAQSTPTEGGLCPFCEGHEDKTPPEIVAYRERGPRPNGPGWRLRLVPHKIPALKAQRQLNQPDPGLHPPSAPARPHDLPRFWPQPTPFPVQTLDFTKTAPQPFREHPQARRR